MKDLKDEDGLGTLIKDGRTFDKLAGDALAEAPASGRRRPSFAATTTTTKKKKATVAWHFSKEGPPRIASATLGFACAHAGFARRRLRGAPAAAAPDGTRSLATFAASRSARRNISRRELGAHSAISSSPPRVAPTYWASHGEARLAMSATGGRWVRSPPGLPRTSSRAETPGDDGWHVEAPESSSPRGGPPPVPNASGDFVKLSDTLSTGAAAEICDPVFFGASREDGGIVEPH